jgi:hypothetical protein
MLTVVVKKDLLPRIDFNFMDAIEVPEIFKQSLFWNVHHSANRQL